MTAEDSTIDTLLERLDKPARSVYPHAGLPIWDSRSVRDQMREIVRQWLLENSQESQR